MQKSFLTNLFAWLRPPRRLKSTTLGKFVILMTIVVGVAAINTGNNLLYLVLGGLNGLIAASGLLSERTLKHLTIMADIPEVTMAGQPTSFTARVSTGRFPVYLVWLELVDVEQNIIARAPLSMMPAKTTQTVTLHIQPQQRGIVKLKELRLVTRFPFQMYQKTRWLALNQQIWVAPQARVLLPDLPIKQTPEAATAGQKSKAAGQDEFIGLRQRLTSDSKSHIHWRRSVLPGQYLTKVFQRQITSHLTLDIQQGQSAVEFETALEQVMGYLNHSQNAGYDVDIQLGQQLYHSQSQEHVFLLKALATINRVDVLPGTPALRVV